MKITEQVSGSPLRVQRSLRGDNLRALTSGKAGKILPLAYFPLLREDAIRRGPVGVTVRMAETVHPLINAVVVKLYAHLLPFSAFSRFSGMDEFNRSYAGESHSPHFFDMRTSSSQSLFWRTLGIHHKVGENFNSAPLEAYNTVVNFRRRARSKHLPLRSNLAGTLARAFWSHPIMHDVVPDYEEALIDGAVTLEPIDSALSSVPLRFKADDPSYTLPLNANFSHQQTKVDGFQRLYNRDGSNVDERNLEVQMQPFYDALTSEMKLSLSNIELAKQTVAFAELRQQYQGISDEHLIDLLMDAIRVPPEALRQPILIGSASGTIQMNERFAMDGDNLDLSRTTGAVSLAMNLRTPPINTGGIVMVTAEITPEPLFERLGDKFLMTSDPNELPQFLRDYLDPKKVEIVENRQIDVLHDTPDGLFGYRGLNRGWDRDFTRAGGKFFRPIGDAYKEDRQRFWVVESNNPSLTEDFFLVSDDLPYTPFADRTADPFEILTVGSLQIEGNTVFGKKLHEDTGAYQAIIDRVTQEDGE